MGENKSRSFLQLLDHGEENDVILMYLGKRAFPFRVSVGGVRSWCSELQVLATDL